MLHLCTVTEPFHPKIEIINVGGVQINITMKGMLDKGVKKSGNGSFLKKACRSPWKMIPLGFKPLR